jgi:hypothetical protein
MNFPWVIRNYVIFHKFVPFMILYIMLLMSISNLHDLYPYRKTGYHILGRLLCLSI